MASVIDSMEDLGKAADKSTEALQRTAVAMEEVEKAAVAMAKSVSGAVKELVKMTFVAKGLGKTIMGVVVGIKILVQSISQAIGAFVRWMISIGLTIGLFVVLGKVLAGIPGKIDPVIIKLNEFGTAAAKALNDVYIGLNNLISRIGGAIYAFEAWVIAGGPVAQMLVSMCNFLNKDLSASLEKIISRIAVAIYAFDAWLGAGSLLAQAFLNFSNFLAKDFSDSLANMIAMVRDAILAFSEWFGSSSNVAVLLQEISRFIKEDFSEAIDNLQLKIESIVQGFKDWVEEAGLLYQALEGLAMKWALIGDILEGIETVLSAIGDIIDKIQADWENGGFYDGGWINVDADSGSNINKAVNNIPSQAASMLSELSPIGLSPVYGGNTSNTTNITYNVRTTKEMSLRNAERERRLYSR